MINSIPSIASQIFDNKLSLKLKKESDGISIPVYGVTSEGVTYVNNVGITPAPDIRLIAIMNTTSTVYSYSEPDVYSTDNVSATGGSAVLSPDRTSITVTWNGSSPRIDILFTLSYIG